jgi:hypothetical protein
MTRIFAGIAIVTLFVLALAAGGYTSAKSYQVTGVIKAADATGMTVEKSAKETWQFELTKDTKGTTPKVGDRVTISYRMTATEIEASNKK